MQRAKVGVLLLNEAGQITFANSVATHLLDLPQDAIGQVFGSQQQFVNQQGEVLAFEQLPTQQALTTGQAVSNMLLGLNLTDQPSPRWLRFEVELQVNSGEAIALATQLVCLCWEVDSPLAQGLPDLDDGAMLAYMGHELRTPLNAILGFTQLMQRDQTLASNHHELLSIIERSGEQLLNLISDLVELGKIKAGQASLNYAPLSLRNLLTGLEQILSLKAEAQGLPLQFDLAAEVPTYVKADEGKLRQSLLSLLSSIIRLSQSEPLHIAVESVATSASEMVLRLQVFSSSANVAQLRSHLLEATQQQNPDGWNLRLTISQKLIQMLGGTLRIGAESDLVAVCELPIWLTEPEGSDAQAQTQNQIVGLASDQPAYQILVVDDDPVSRSLMARILGEIGFKVKQAIDGQQAVQIWQQCQPDLIFMDMRMPKMDGYEATQQIKAQAPALPILVLTANQLTAEQIRAAQWTDLVSKPVRREVLLGKLQQHLGLRYLYEAASRPPEQPVALPLELQIETLQQMPHDWLQAVYQAAAQGSDRLIYNLVQQVPAEQLALSKAITALADEFQFDQILKCLQRAGLDAA